MRAWLRRRRLTLLGVVLVYIVFIMFGGCADKLILFPQRYSADAGGAVRRLIPFQDGQLEAVIAKSPAAQTRPVQAVVLTFVGNAALAEHSSAHDAREWGEKPVEVWTINHPGYGGSTGPASLSRLHAAALTAYDAVKGDSPDRPILVSGYSLGCTMALHVAANRSVAGAFLRTPPPLRQMILGHFGWWNLWLLAGPVAWGVPRELDAIANARLARVPAVFFVIEADEVIPIRYQKMVHDAYAGPRQMVTMNEGDHNAAVAEGLRGELRGKMDWLWREALGGGAAPR